MEKIIKARKDHTCDFCDRSISSGEDYLLITGKGGRFDDKDNQIGIEFFRLKAHITDKGDVPCHAPEDCRKGDHPDYAYESGYDGDICNEFEPGYYCKDCGHFLTEDEYNKENKN